MDEVALLVGPLAKHHSTQLQIEVQGLESTAVHADPELLQQMLLNVVLNAIEAAGPGGWVRVEGVREKEQAILCILDSGPGPPENIRSRLFEPFATGKPEGIGLGLVAARRIAQAHEGELVFKCDRPTCFEFRMKADA